MDEKILEREALRLPVRDRVLLADRPSVDSDEISSDIVLDMDADNNIVGIEIEHASSNVDLGKD